MKPSFLLLLLHVFILGMLEVLFKHVYGYSFIGLMFECAVTAMVTLVCLLALLRILSDQIPSTSLLMVLLISFSCVVISLLDFLVGNDIQSFVKTSGIGIFVLMGYRSSQSLFRDVYQSHVIRYFETLDKDMVGFCLARLRQAREAHESSCVALSETDEANKRHKEMAALIDKFAKAIETGHTRQFLLSLPPWCKHSLLFKNAVDRMLLLLKEREELRHYERTFMFWQAGNNSHKKRRFVHSFIAKDHEISQAVEEVMIKA